MIHAALLLFVDVEPELLCHMYIGVGYSEL
jgi:hypothetical protein